MFLSISGGIPIARTIVVKKRVNKVKLRAKPITTPNGLRFPPPIELLNTTGKTGRIQGESIVTTPAKNENPARINIS